MDRVMLCVGEEEGRKKGDRQAGEGRIDTKGREMKDKLSQHRLTEQQSNAEPRENC